MRGGSLSAAAFAFLAAALAWHVASPWWTLRELRAAAARRDEAALAAHVDHQALRASLPADEAGLAATSRIGRLLPAAAAIERAGFSTFRAAAAAGQGPVLVFRRHGYAWKLSAVEPPPPP